MISWYVVTEKLCMGLGQQSGHTKLPSFMFEWDSRDRDIGVKSLAFKKSPNAREKKVLRKNLVN